MTELSIYWENSPDEFSLKNNNQDFPLWRTGTSTVPSFSKKYTSLTEATANKEEDSEENSGSGAKEEEIESDESGESEESGESGESADWEESGESGESGDYEESGESGDSEISKRDEIPKDQG